MSVTDFSSGSSETPKELAANARITAARASSVDEARILIKRCAGPCHAGESIKSALRRVSQRLEFSHVRTRALWYGEARRIDAKEMDRLREVADRVELVQAVRAIETLAARIRPSASSEAKTVASDLTTILGAANPDSFSPILELLRTHKTTIVLDG